MSAETALADLVAAVRQTVKMSHQIVRSDRARPYCSTHNRYLLSERCDALDQLTDALRQAEAVLGR